MRAGVVMRRKKRIKILRHQMIPPEISFFRLTADYEESEKKRKKHFIRCKSFRFGVFYKTMRKDYRYRDRDKTADKE